MDNKNVHISGFYAIIAAIIGAVLSAACAYYFTSSGNEASEQEYTTYQNTELENENGELTSQRNGNDGDVSKGDNPGGVDDNTENTTTSSNLFEQNELIGKTEDLTNSSVDFVDNVGNTYPRGYSIYYDGNGNKSGREVTYALDGKYTTLRGTIALRSSENDIRDGVWLEFYDNNTLIYQTGHLYAGVLPIEFSVDVSQIDRLKVKANGGDQFAFILTSGFYLE